MKIPQSNDQLQPTVFVIFGGAGDLTWRKLVPALFDLSQERSMPADFSVIAVDRVDLSDEKLRRRLHDGVNQFSRFGKVKAAAWNQFAQHIHYQKGDKVDVLHAVRPIHRDTVHECVVRGQYGQGWVDGKKVPGYREEENVAPDSQKETFVALRLFLDNWRWQGVPFYLRTGKRLTWQASEISIQFRGVPHQSFPTESTLDWQSSRLVMAIQPDDAR